MPELGYRPVNKYLPPRRRAAPPAPAPSPVEIAPTGETASPLLRWVDRLLSR
jgi:hypothetical protein